MRTCLRFTASQKIQPPISLCKISGASIKNVSGHQKELRIITHKMFSSLSPSSLVLQNGRKTIVCHGPKYARDISEVHGSSKFQFVLNRKQFPLPFIWFCPLFSKKLCRLNRQCYKQNKTNQQNKILLMIPQHCLKVQQKCKHMVEWLCFKSKCL